MIIKTCKKCGAQIEIIKDCKCDNCGIKCCGETMCEIIVTNETASIEKHTPVYTKVGEYVYVTVPHPSDTNHYITHIGIKSDRISARKSFLPGEEFKAIFPYIKGSILYSICSTHGICETVVE